MSDVQTIWDTLNARGDWAMSGPSLASGNDLYTAVLISLFTDRVAHPTDVIPDGTTNPRGWWGDNQIDGSVDPIGSRLWLLDRSKAPTTQVLNQAVDYCKEALQWMLDDGVAANINVQASWNAPNYLALVVTISQTNDTTPKPFKFDLLWQEIV
jgi:phage gp46-like protein